MKDLQKILDYLKDKVIVVGSYANYIENESSDIDFFVRSLPEDLCDYEKGIDTYSNQIYQYLKDLNHKLDSCYPLTFMDRSTLIPLDFSPFFTIDERNLEEREIFGITMKICKSSV